MTPITYNLTDDDMLRYAAPSHEPTRNIDLSPLTQADRDYLATLTYRGALPARYYPATDAEEIGVFIRLDQQNAAMEQAEKLEAHRKHNAQKLADDNATAREYAAAPYTTKPPHIYRDPDSYYTDVDDGHAERQNAIIASVDATTRRNEEIKNAVDAIRDQATQQARAEIISKYGNKPLYTREGPRFVRI